LEESYQRVASDAVWRPRSQVLVQLCFQGCCG
jgi:hypothetical protein